MEEGGVEVKKGESRSLLHVNTLVQAQDTEVSDPWGTLTLDEEEQDLLKEGKREGIMLGTQSDSM